MLGHTVVLVRGQIPFRDRVPILFVQACKNMGKIAGALTPGAVHSGDHADLSINVQSATHHTPQSNVGIDTLRNIELYEIGKSPIISSVVEETLKNIQSLIGMLNFACQVVVPDRAFCRRLIDSTCNVKQSWHRIRVSVEMKADLQVWLTFLKDYNGVSVMLDQFWTSNET